LIHGLKYVSTPVMRGRRHAGDRRGLLPWWCRRCRLPMTGSRSVRWSQTEGIERLEPTTDVVASPPDADLTPKADYVVRIVRVSKQPVTSEEGYRLLVDELPSPVQWQGRTVNLLVRSSIPVFFGPPQVGGPSVAWTVSVQGEKLIVGAQNNGNRRLRISARPISPESIRRSLVNPSERSTVVD